MILTGNSVNTYGIKSADLEEKRQKVSENASVPTFGAQQLPEQSAQSTLCLQRRLAVTSSAALINNVLTLGGKRPGSALANSWETRRRREPTDRLV